MTNERGRVRFVASLAFLCVAACSAVDDGSRDGAGEGSRTGPNASGGPESDRTPGLRSSTTIARVAEPDRPGAAAAAGPRYADVGGAVGADRFLATQLFVQEASGKARGGILAVGRDSSARPVLKRCDHDGTGCANHLLDGGRGLDSAEELSAAFDSYSSAMHVVVADGSWHEMNLPAGSRNTHFVPPELAWLRCGLLGSSVDCTRTLLEGASEVAHSGSARVVIDEANRKLLVPAAAIEKNALEQSLPKGMILYRCGLDGTACEKKNLTAPVSEYPYWQPADAFVDQTAKKLVVVAHGFDGASSVVRCNLDGTSCAQQTLPPSNDDHRRSYVFDDVGRKLLVVTSVFEFQNGYHLRLLRCEVDGTGCTDSALTEDIVSTIATGRMVGAELVVTSESGHGPVIFRCTAAGAPCSRTDIADDTSGVFDPTPVATFDAARDSLLLFTPISAQDGPTDQGFAPLVFRKAWNGAGVARYDVSAQPGETRYMRSAVIDETSNKLLVLSYATKDLRPETSDGITLTRCNLGGTGCVATNVPNAFDATLVGTFQNRLYSVVHGLTSDGQDDQLELRRCALDGSACQATTITTENETLSGAALDLVREQAVVVTQTTSDRHARARRCPLAGGACSAATELPVGRFSNGAIRFENVDAIAIDSGAEKLVVDAGHRVLRCSVDGTGCADFQISFAEPVDPTGFTHRHPRAIVHGGYAIVPRVVATGPGQHGVALFRCALGGTSCTRADLALGAGEHDVFDGSVTIDTRSNRLLLVTQDFFRFLKPTLVRCNLDGSACEERDVSAGEPAESGHDPTALFDATGQRLLAVTLHRARLARPSLFSLSLAP